MRGNTCILHVVSGELINNHDKFTFSWEQVCFTQSIAEAEEKDKHTTDALPYLYMIGESTIPESHLVISGKKFVIQDPIEAFDLLFKSYVALSLNYPDEWKHVWLFIQKSIYNVHKDSDLKLSNVSTLINDISKVSNA